MMPETAPMARVPQSYQVSPGRPLPLGVQDCCDGFNFAVFSRHAERVELVVFERATDPVPSFSLDLRPPHHRTGDIWHARIAGLRWGQAYAYRVHGPWAPERGERFDGRIYLLDPYALAAEPLGRPEDHVAADGRSPASPHRSILVDRRFDWQGTCRPRTAWPDTIIYETHIRGLTIDPSAGSAHPGTFLGLVDRIPYFQELGITAVQLMPIQEFATSRPGTMAPSDSGSRHNYWGYDTIAFFAPKASYSNLRTAGAQVDAFKTMVREMHRAGVEVILDMVFNHTAEGDANGPVFNFRGLDNAIYYLLDDDKSRYRNYSGCGNTLNCNHPVVRDYVIDCLRYWATEMQVDGFRFDLASVMGRDETGLMMRNPPLLERIAEDPVLRDVKLIAEAWDAAGAYQVGCFPGQRWAEWNGRYRDDVRRFWRGDPGLTGALASRLCGSADLYQRDGKQPVNSVNFITCHDGFTLNDLVSYERKHNDANGEDNRDGPVANFSANYGMEGPTDEPVIEAVRIRQIKNMLATLFLSRGVPMILGGDEFRRSQRGNNNAYCQDNAISWYDWRLLDQNREIFVFVQALIAFRRQNPVLRADAFYTDADIAWFGPGGAAPDWNGQTSAVGCLVRQRRNAAGGAESEQLCLLFNGSRMPNTFVLPASGSAGWRLCFDTFNPLEVDGSGVAGTKRALDHSRYELPPHALAVLVSG